MHRLCRFLYTSEAGDPAPGFLTDSDLSTGFLQNWLTSVLSHSGGFHFQFAVDAGFSLLSACMYVVVNDGQDCGPTPAKDVPARVSSHDRPTGYYN
jgi:hypothetical protein